MQIVLQIKSWDRQLRAIERIYTIPSLFPRGLWAPHQPSKGWSQ